MFTDEFKTISFIANAGLTSTDHTVINFMTSLTNFYGQIRSLSNEPYNWHPFTSKWARNYHKPDYFVRMRINACFKEHLPCSLCCAITNQNKLSINNRKTNIIKQQIVRHLIARFIDVFTLKNHFVSQT